MVIVSILPHAKFGRNDHREDTPHFSKISTYGQSGSIMLASLKLAALTINNRILFNRMISEYLKPLFKKDAI